MTMRASVFHIDDRRAPSISSCVHPLGTRASRYTERNSEHNTAAQDNLPKIGGLESHSASAYTCARNARRRRIHCAYWRRSFLNELMSMPCDALIRHFSVSPQVGKRVRIRCRIVLLIHKYRGFASRLVSCPELTKEECQIIVRS